MTDHYRQAEYHLDVAKKWGTSDPEAERVHVAYAGAHAKLAIADRADKLADAFAAWRADIDSEPAPDVEQMVDDFLACTPCGGTGNAPVEQRVPDRPRGEEHDQPVGRPSCGWAWGDDNEPIDLSRPGATSVRAAEGPLRDVPAKFPTADDGTHYAGDSCLGGHS